MTENLKEPQTSPPKFCDSVVKSIIQVKSFSYRFFFFWKWSFTQL